MRVLIACEFSGIVRDAFIAGGHDAWSCDTLPTENEGPHYECDVFDVVEDGWDLMVAHPPCTYLSNSGVCWLVGDKRKRGRMEHMVDGARFFRRLLEAPVPRLAVENPVMHKYAAEIVGRRQDQVIQPWQFGHPESKATCLWLKNLPPLEATNDVREEMFLLTKPERERVAHVSSGPDRWKERSRTLRGIAAAMATQWGST
jgi:hypothetical protein